MLEVALQLLCSKKPGTLSRVIREISIVGLQYRSHRIESVEDYTRLTINAIGELNCSLESLEQLFEGFPEVMGVVQLSATRGGKNITEVKTRVSKTRISAADQITPAITLAAEKRLSDILGPVASVIVASVTSSCANAGQLYARLAEELDDEAERARFLSIIDRDH